MATPNRLSRGDAVVGALTVTNDLTVGGNLNLSGDISLDDITLADSVTVTTLAAGSVAIGGGTTIKKITTNTVSVNLPEIAAGAIGSQTATITGVAAGDFVAIMTPDSGSAGVVITGANVTGANTITVYAVNLTAEPVDPAAVTIRYLWADLT